MSIEIKQVHKLSQQLVMTPQLQQAIKLLQLSRMELVDLVREEMMENPILEDGADTGQELSRERDEMGGEAAGETELAAPDPARLEKVETQGEVKGDGAAAVNEIDWENYLDNYTMAPP